MSVLAKMSWEAAGKRTHDVDSDQPDLVIKVVLIHMAPAELEAKEESRYTLKLHSFELPCLMARALTVIEAQVAQPALHNLTWVGAPWSKVGHININFLRDLMLVGKQLELH